MEKSNEKRNGFTFIEILAVIIILGIILLIVVPSITDYIQKSKREAYVRMAKQYINGAVAIVNSEKLPIYDVEATYYYPAKCISLEKGGDSPYGKLLDAYVVMTYDGDKYDYYWTSRDSANMGILLTADHLLHESKVKSNIKKISTDIAVGEKTKILLIKKCDGSLIEEKMATEKIPVDGEYVPNESITIPEVIRPEEDYNNYLAVSSTVSNDSAKFFNGTIARRDVEEIYTVSSNEVPSGVIKSWDASEQHNGSIMAWVLDEDNDGKYELYLGQNRGVVANPNSVNLFKSFKNVTKMDLSNLDTSRVTIMDNMFDSCKSLTTLDVSNFNTSNVTRMFYMFFGCSSLLSLDLSNFDTSNVTTMYMMFYGCNALVSLNVSSFNTSKVTTMYGMFDGCSSLTSLDVSSFDTSQVTMMYSMFFGCRSLTSLDISNFDTSKVTNMSNMFCRCRALTNLDISNLDVSNVVYYSNVFAEVPDNCNVKVKNNEIKSWVLDKNSNLNVIIK